MQQASAAHDTHPLLSPGPTSPASEAASSTSTSAVPKYVPYTPRQRVTPTAATTGTTVHPASPQQQGDATSKLQLMHLKAAAQGIGLDSGTLGWSILEKLVNDDGEEWQEIWAAVTAGKVCCQYDYRLALESGLITYQGDFVVAIRVGFHA
jgi:hypothetical protein